MKASPGSPVRGTAEGFLGADPGAGSCCSPLRTGSLLSLYMRPKHRPSATATRHCFTPASLWRRYRSLRKNIGRA